MIRSFKSKGLADFAKTGAPRCLSVKNFERVARVLAALDVAGSPQDMDIPGFRFHEMSGVRKGTYSVRVTGNWRITFQFEGNDATNVDLEDYHK